MRKFLIVFVALSLVTACGSYKPRVGTPWMQKKMFEGPEGPTIFKEGWRDGCETGVSVTSNAMQRHYYSFKQDPEKARDKVYYTAWKTSFWYCSRYVFQYLRRHTI